MEQKENKDIPAPQEAPTSYAVRPHHHHHRRLEYSDRGSMFKTRNILNCAFMILAVIGVIMWNVMESQTVAIIILLIGVALKVAEVCIRLFRK